MGNALMPIEPSNLAEAVDFSERVSKAGLLAMALRNKPADVLVAILTGRELGLSPMQSLRGMHVIEGKPTMSADLMVALCVRRPDICKYFTCRYTDATRATYETDRAGAGATKLSFTIDQAKAAGLAGKDNWRKYPDAMLRSRCAAALARMVYPDLLAGVYDPDEIGLAPEVQPQRPAIVAEFTQQAVVTAADEERAAAHTPDMADEPATDRPAVALEQQIREAKTLEGLTAIKDAVIAAHKAGAVSTDEKSALAVLFSDRRTALSAGQQQPKAEAA